MSTVDAAKQDINTTVDVSDDFYINFLKTCHEQVSKFRKYFTIHSVRSFETGNTMAEV